MYATQHSLSLSPEVLRESSKRVLIKYKFYIELYIEWTEDKKELVSLLCFVFFCKRERQCSLVN